MYSFIVLIWLFNCFLMIFFSVFSHSCLYVNCIESRSGKTWEYIYSVLNYKKGICLTFQVFHGAYPNMYSNQTRHHHSQSEFGRTAIFSHLINLRSVLTLDYGKEIQSGPTYLQPQDGNLTPWLPAFPRRGSKVQAAHLYCTIILPQGTIWWISPVTRHHKGELNPGTNVLSLQGLIWNGYLNPPCSIWTRSYWD